jgi:hypothetical protein
LFKPHDSIHESKQGIVASPANVQTGHELTAALPHYNSAGTHELAAEHFHTEPFAV